MAGAGGGKNETIRIPEVLIGEFFKYAFRTDYLAPTCADAQVFFRTVFTCLPVAPIPQLVYSPTINVSIINGTGS